MSLNHDARPPQPTDWYMDDAVPPPPLSEEEARQMALRQDAEATRPDERTILVWAYAEAPMDLQRSNNGGDEDWVAVLPAGMARPDWMADGSAFAPYRCEEHKLADGRTLIIAVHS